MWIVYLQDYDRQMNDVFASFGPYATKKIAVQQAAIIASAWMKRNDFVVPPEVEVVELFSPLGGRNPLRPVVPGA